MGEEGENCCGISTKYSKNGKIVQQKKVSQLPPNARVNIGFEIFLPSTVGSDRVPN